MNVEKNKNKENLNLYDRRAIPKGFGPKMGFRLTLSMTWWKRRKM
jgi:hypothetical protein